MNKAEKILVTSALPYANGSIHIGHLLEYIQTDIFVRYLKLTGQDAILLCADDTHGTPIYLKARDQKISPEELINKYSAEHQRDFKDFHIDFDYYYTTNSIENKKHCIYIYEELKKRDHISVRTVLQYFCEIDDMFLSDRFIKGTCPNCNATDQYGDGCEICGFHYDPINLLQPYCSLCGTKPILKNSNHYFFKLSDFTAELKEWANQSGHLQNETLSSIKEWLDNGLKDWDISRDAPYFGFNIPGEANKYFYVWVDAPVGYISTTEKYCHESGKDFNSYWHNSDAKIYHFIGKDIIYFHTLFWPAMLMGSGYTLPSKICVHGFLTVNGTKMSKTRGTFITAHHFNKFLDPQYLRYYYASKLSQNSEDIDLNVTDFRLRVNAELINNIVNIGSRAVTMLNKNFDSVVGSMDEIGNGLFNDLVSKLTQIEFFYNDREFAKAIKMIIELSDLTNKYFTDNEPWKLLNSNPGKAHQICAFSLNAFKLICVAIKPVLPKLANDVEDMLNLDYQYWSDAKEILTPRHTINRFKPLITRVEAASIEAMLVTENGS